MTKLRHFTKCIYFKFQGDLMQRTTPNKLDDETLKFIRQKRPRLQCKGSVRSEGGCKFGSHVLENFVSI